MDDNQDILNAPQIKEPCQKIYCEELDKEMWWPKIKPIPPGFVKGARKFDTSYLKERKWYHNPETGEQKFTDKIPSEDFIRGRCPNYLKNHSKKLIEKHLKWYTNGKENLFASKDDIIPNDFYPGKIHKNKPSGKRHQDYIWITDGQINRQQPKSDDIPIGWMAGRFMKHMQGESNPSSKVVKYDGKIYNTFNEAVSATGLSKYKLLRRGLEILS